MAYASMKTIFMNGRQAELGKIEIQLSSGLPTFFFSGLVRGALRESPQRVRACFQNLGLSYPQRKILISCQPADTAKDGSHYDLALAVLLAEATGQGRRVPEFQEALILGELDLQGDVQAFSDLLNYLRAASDFGFRDIILSDVDTEELTACREAFGHLRLWPVRDLKSCLNLVTAGDSKSVSAWRLPAPNADEELNVSESLRHFALIPSQGELIYALAVAAAGWHPLFIIGAPGTGKSFTAEIMRYLQSSDRSDQLRPFVSCHHSVTRAALIGGGVPIREGLVTKADGGTLFLDELTEFHSQHLDLLREILSSGQVELARADEHCHLPADFLLVAAANPCPCGYYLDGQNRCTCAFTRVERYQGKISGPLWDRFQLQVSLRTLPAEELAHAYQEEAIAAGQRKLSFLRQAVARAVERQKERANQQGLSEWRNGRIQEGDLIKIFQVNLSARQALIPLASMRRLTARGVSHLLGVARTMADLADRDELDLRDLHLALSYLPVRPTVAVQKQQWASF